jgi:hypothetical protein
VRLLLCVLLAGAAQARDVDPAALVPGSSILYVEADGRAVQEGLRGLDLAGVVGDPEHHEFFEPLLERLTFDPAGWLAGRAAFAVRGLTIDIEVPGSEPRRVVLSAERPVDAGLIFELLGSTLRGRLQGERTVYTYGFDLAAVLEPGPQLRGWVEDFLGAPPDPLVRGAVQIADRQVLRLRVPSVPAVDEWNRFGMELYADLSGDRWLVATDPAVLGAMLSGGPRDSLARSPDFLADRDRLAGGRRALYVHVDARRALGIFRSVFPPIQAEVAERAGIGSIRGAGFGLSFLEGGVRESVGVFLDGEPRGAWRLLDAFPAGLTAPPEAAAAVAIRFDAGRFVERLREFLDVVAPGYWEPAAEAVRTRFRDATELDLEGDVLPALGDEASLLLFEPESIVPRWALTVRARDPEAFAALIEKVSGRLRREDAVLEPVTVAPGIEGFSVLAAFPMRPPVFALHGDRFAGAHDPELLLAALRGPAAEPDEAFRRTLRGLNGGSLEDLSALAYVDLRRALPDLVGAALQNLPDGWVDMQHMPDPKQLVSRLGGAALGLRHDDEAIILDLFTPTGVLPLAAVARSIYYRDGLPVPRPLPPD